MAYGGRNTPPDPERQRAFLEETARHQEVPLSMLLGVIGVEQTVKLNEYQQQAFIPELLAEPVDPAFKTEAPEVAASIVNNTAMYDDNLEDALAADPVLSWLLELPGSEERSRAIRARRTVAALVLSLPPADESSGKPEAGVA